MTLGQKIVRIQIKIKICENLAESSSTQCEFKRKSLIETISSEFGAFQTPYYGTSIWQGNKVWLNVSCGIGYDLQNQSSRDFQYIFLTFNSFELSKEIEKTVDMDNTAKKDY
jgi:hypothetical protein